MFSIKHIFILNTTLNCFPSTIILCRRCGIPWWFRHGWILHGWYVLGCRAGEEAAWGCWERAVAAAWSCAILESCSRGGAKLEAGLGELVECSLWDWVIELWRDDAILLRNCIYLRKRFIMEFRLFFILSVAFGIVIKHSHLGGLDLGFIILQLFWQIQFVVMELSIIKVLFPDGLQISLEHFIFIHDCFIFAVQSRVLVDEDLVLLVDLLLPLLCICQSFDFAFQLSYFMLLHFHLFLDFLNSYFILALFIFILLP